MPPKRPIRNVFGEADDDDPTLKSSTLPKRTRTTQQPTTSLIDSIKSGTSQNGVQLSSSSAGVGAVAASAPAPPGSVQAQIEAARARIQAQMSSLSSRATSSPRPPQPPTSASAAAATANSAQSNPSTSTNPTIAAPRPGAAPPASFNEIQRKVAEAKARLEAMQRSSSVQKGLQTAQSAGNGRTLSASQPNSTASLASAARSETSKPPTGIHPLLLSSNSDNGQEQLRSMAPKFASLQANARPSSSTSGYQRGLSGQSSVQPQANPYLAHSFASAETDSDIDGVKPKSRSMHRGFAFHRPGRHIEEAEEARREAQLEDLKRRIQESARKAGMQDDLTGDEKIVQRHAPPDVEWWDAGLLPNKSYDDVPDGQDVYTMLEKGKARETDPEASVDGPLLFGKGTPIDHYIQHPIPIPAPSDKVQIKPAGVMLTKKEMKKMRRQRRAAEQQDKRDRIKMGLLPPDPPKVKLSNLMRVLTSEAVADPTKVEARVRREIAARKEAHERANQERKLTPDERKEKARRKAEQDEIKGLGCQVYKVKHLVEWWHKRRIRTYAQYLGLSGITVFNPSFALVLVEGSAKGLKGFKRLMTVRTDWTEPSRAHEKHDDGSDGDDGDAQNGSANPQQQQLRRTRYEDLSAQDRDSVDLSENKCELIFEGPIRARTFGDKFRGVLCPTDHAAKEALGDKMDGYWDLAKRWVAPEDEG